jgi:hypothetical protein
VKQVVPEDVYLAAGQPDNDLYPAKKRRRASLRCFLLDWFLKNLRRKLAKSE